MKPSLPPNVLEYFEGKLKECNNYLEFGTGGSTVLASKYVKNSIISIESDKEWYNNVLSEIGNNDKIKIHLVDLYCLPRTWGHPSSKCPINNKKEYSNIIKKLNINNVDLVLIDGRFRAACALKLHSLISKNTIVLFDDFMDRVEHYNIVLNYYNVIKTIGRMVHLQKKENVIVKPNDILKYELMAI